MIKSLDHIAFRVNSRLKGYEVLSLLGYKIEDKFEIDFGGEGKADSYSLTAPNLTELFITDGEKGTIISEWIKHNGPGIHHVAFATDNIQEDIDKFRNFGITFSTPNYLSCEDLKQIFTQPIEVLGGIVIELIERKTKGFCAGNVKALMESSYNDGSDG